MAAAGIFAGGDGNWTPRAPRVVANHLRLLGLVELRYIDFNGDGHGWQVWCVTSFGRAIAEYLIANEGKIEFHD
jgi:hypothetical protein